MSEQIKFEDIEAGDKVTMTMTVEVLERDDEDRSLRIKGHGWFFDENLSPTYTRETPPLIPDDAEFVVWNLSGRDLLLWKSGEYWTDSDEDEYEDTAALIERIEAICARNEIAVDVTVLDRRAK